MLSLQRQIKEMVGSEANTFLQQEGIYLNEAIEEAIGGLAADGGFLKSYILGSVLKVN